jgi:hypothetical protein
MSAVAPEGDQPNPSALSELTRHVKFAAKHKQLLAQLVSQYEAQLNDLSLIVDRLSPGGGDKAAGEPSWHCLCSQDSSWTAGPAEQVVAPEKGAAEAVEEIVCLTSPAALPAQLSPQQADGEEAEADGEEDEAEESPKLGKHLRQVWSRRPPIARVSGARHKKGDRASYTKDLADSVPEYSREVQQSDYQSGRWHMYRRCLAPFIMRPTSNIRAVWDIGS